MKNLKPIGLEVNCIPTSDRILLARHRDVGEKIKAYLREQKCLELFLSGSDGRNQGGSGTTRPLSIRAILYRNGDPERAVGQQTTRGLHAGREYSLTEAGRSSQPGPVHLNRQTGRTPSHPKQPVSMDCGGDRSVTSRRTSGFWDAQGGDQASNARPTTMVGGSAGVL